VFVRRVGFRGHENSLREVGEASQRVGKLAGWIGAIDLAR
jgi:hypothetical protein